MEKQKWMQMDWVVSSKREHHYDEIRELIGQLTLIENHIRLRQCNGALQRDEVSLRILLDQHRDAVRDLGMHLISLKILDREDEEEYVEDEDERDMRAEDDDEHRKAIDQYKDADDADDEAVEKDDTCDSAVEPDCVCKQIRDIDIL